MANLFANTFTANLDGTTQVLTSGTITAGVDGADHSKPTSNWAQLGLYTTDAITAAGQHTIYFKYKFGLVNTNAMILLRDTTGISHTAGGSIRVGAFCSAIAGGQRIITWDGSGTGGTPFDISVDTFYDLKFEVSNSTGYVTVSAKTEASPTYTTIGSISIDVRGQDLRFATNVFTGSTGGYHYFVKNFTWTDDGNVDVEADGALKNVGEVFIACGCG